MLNPHAELAAPEHLSTIASRITPLRAAARSLHAEYDRAADWAAEFTDPADRRIASSALSAISNVLYGLSDIEGALVVAYGVLATLPVTGGDPSLGGGRVVQAFGLTASVTIHLSPIYLGFATRPEMKLPVPDDREHLAVLLPTLKTLGDLARLVADPEHPEADSRLYGKRHEELLDRASRLAKLTPEPPRVPDAAEGPAELADLAPQQRAHASAIREALARAGIGGLSVGELQGLAGRGRNTVYDMLSILVARNLAARDKGGRYHLPPRLVTDDTLPTDLLPPPGA